MLFQKVTAVTIKIKIIDKHAYPHHRAIINIFIQMIFINIMTYLDRTFKKEQNEIILLLNWSKF